MNKDATHQPQYYLPHSEPMVLIDRYVKDITDGVVCEVDITKDSMFVRNNFVPAYVGIEYMAQTIGVYAGRQKRAKGQELDIGFLLGARSMQLNTDKFETGTTLEVTCTLAWDSPTLKQFDCSVADKKSKINLITSRLSVYLPKDNNE